MLRALPFLNRSRFWGTWCGGALVGAGVPQCLRTPVLQGKSRAQYREFLYEQDNAKAGACLNTRMLAVLSVSATTLVWSDSTSLIHSPRFFGPVPHQGNGSGHPTIGTFHAERQQRETGKMRNFD